MLVKLIEIQQREGWRDAEMASRLRVARSTWCEIRNGNLPLSAKHQMTAANAFPELLGDLVRSVSAVRPQDAA